MKFAVTLSDNSGKTLSRVSGFPTIEDACGSACDMAARRHGSALFVRVRSAGKVLHGSTYYFAGICCDHTEDYTLTGVIVAALKARAKLKEEQRRTRARQKFLKDHGGFDGALSRRLFTTERDAALAEFFFANNFDAVTKRMAELGLTTEVAA